MPTIHLKLIRTRIVTETKDIEFPLTKDAAEILRDPESLRTWAEYTAGPFSPGDWIRTGDETKVELVDYEWKED